NAFGSVAFATAEVKHAIYQLAFGDASATAAAHLENEGTIAMDAEASAYGRVTVNASARFGGRRFNGATTAAILNVASAAAGASATFTNDAVIAISAHAQAMAAGGGSGNVFASVLGWGAVSQIADA